jgi:hypothetical protein
MSTTRGEPQTSQVVIVAAWSDAMVGTIANLLLLMALLYGFAARGPLSLRAEYEHHLKHEWPVLRHGEWPCPKRTPMARLIKEQSASPMIPLARGVHSPRGARR